MSLLGEEIENRVSYHEPTPQAAARHQAVRETIKNAIQTIVGHVPAGREQSVAITKLEEAMFWSNAGIARNHDKLT